MRARRHDQLRCALGIECPDRLEIIDGLLGQIR